MEQRSAVDLDESRSRSGILLRLAAGAFVLLAAASVAMAQVSGSAALRGTVKDETGAVVAQAAVTLTNRDTKYERKATTNDLGLFAFTAVDPGNYTLKVESKGFKTYEEQNLAIAASSDQGVSVQLSVGTAGETVTVTATQEVIQRETGAKEDTITSKQIDNLSIISRSSLELLRILPGVVAPDETQSESVSFGGGANANANYNVNGLRGVENNVTIDGSRLLDIGSNNGTIITPNNDMVQEVKVQVSNYAAEHGTSGVQVTAVTKGGSSAFHGEVYDYVRNHVLNANDRSDTLFGLSKANNAFQYPGGNLGGPVLLPWTHLNRGRDKLFFFFGFEVQRQQVELPTTFDVVPTAAERNGLFNIGGKPTQFAPDPGGFGPKFLNLYPQSNFAPNPSQPIGPGNPNYVARGLQPTNRTQGTLRFDYNITANTKMFVRLARETEGNTFARGLWWNPANYELPTPVVGTNLGRSLSVDVTRIINPTMTNEVLFSASKLKLDNNYQDPSKVSLSSLGITNYKTPFGQPSQFAPVAFITSWGGQTRGDLWNPGGEPLFAHNSDFSVTDNLSKVRGSHTLKFGTTVEQGDKIQNFNGDQEGRYIFAPWGANSTGNEFADIFTGHPAQTVASTNIPTGKFRYYNLELYGQDSWKIRSNFTLEYGLRVAYLPNNAERQALGVVFDPKAYDHTQGVLINGDPKKPNGILTAAAGQIPKGLTDNPPPQFMPRLNFAWDINGKGDTVVRGGAGLFYNRVQGNYQYYSLQQPPNAFSATFSGLTYAQNATTNPFTSIGAVSLTSANLQSNFIPRIATMSLSIARRLPLGNILEVSYVGTEGRHLPDIRNINFVPRGAMLSGHVGNADLSIPVERVAVASQANIVAQFTPFPAYSGINYDEYAGTSSYHSMQVTLSHQAGKRLQFFANYTFSKALGTTVVNETDGNGVDPLDIRHRSWGILPYDRTHIFNASYNYSVPDMARASFLNNPVGRGLLNGWQISGITQFQSGIPIYLKFGGELGTTNEALAFFGSTAFSQQGASSGAVAPIYKKNPSLGGNGFGQTLFDINDITFPAFGQSGATVPPFILRSPSRWNHDVSFFKNFRINENKRIQFRAGFFDIFNQAYPIVPAFQNAVATSDVNLTLNTVCNVTMNHVPNGNGFSDNVCDPTQGFHFDQNTMQNFGKVINKHGHRIIELALKFYF